MQWLADDGVQGDLPFEDRPHGRKLLAALASGQVRTVVVWKIDRLGRSALEILRVVDAISKAGARLVSIVENIDLATPMGQFFLTVLSAFAELERATTVARTVAGKRARLARGQLWGASTPLYGYRLDRATGCRVIDEAEAEVVRSIFRWYTVDGLGRLAILRRLNGEEPGYPRVPSGADGKRARKDDTPPRWGKGALSRLLANPAYKGETIAWTTVTDRQTGKRVARPEADQVRLPDHVTPAIVSPETWAAAQARSGESKVAFGLLKRGGRVYPLRGLVWCACGCRMTGEPWRSGHGYRCTSRHTPAGPCSLRGSWVNAVPLEEWVAAEVAALLADPARIARVIALAAQSSAPDPEVARERDQLRARIARLDREQERLMQRYRRSDDDAFPWALLEREVARAEEEKRAARRQLLEVEAKLAPGPRPTGDLVDAFDLQDGPPPGDWTAADVRAWLDAARASVQVSGAEWRLLAWSGRVELARRG